ncbi:fragile x mental retardation syndrome-related protein 1 [Plakobranchus ocellatus]|uniref:Fragile x mental retardation syndrome-related protein 1 n=1 Tax=Plakobranchus ocellatus TaxID=259542 RepID=A0AAV4DPA8_9GAST|nr:fragile x mental retardation syndrome-related protein 1 [Plakobranchus ocellatus]
MLKNDFLYIAQNILPATPKYDFFSYLIARPKNDKAFKSDGSNASRKQGVKAPVIYTETVSLEKNVVGLAFGKNATNLEKARGLDGVITIDFDGCLSTFRIEAKTHQAAISARKLLEYAEEIFQVPSNIVGLIIGRNGRNILDIKRKSGIERIGEVKEKGFQREKVIFVASSQHDICCSKDGHREKSFEMSP